MAIYLVSYDLNRKKDYARLIARLGQYKAAVRVLYSQWLVESSESVSTVGNDLVKYIDADDGLLVSEMTQQTVWRTLLISDDLMTKWVDAARSCP